MQDFKDLHVWRKAHALALHVYRVTDSDPGRKHVALVGQSRRAAISIGANIAEGCARVTPRDFAKFLNISYASASELENHMILARDIRVIGPREFRAVSQQIDEVRRMLTGLIRRVRERERSGTSGGLRDQGSTPGPPASSSPDD